ncbi:TPA: transcriptional regulator RcsB [Escherichia coli]|nr:transcriptional regulator RcsB [Escherichia coli]
MRQKETTATTRFSLLPGSITRFFLLLIIVLLVTMGVMVQSAVNAWLKDKSYQIVDITHAIQKRVDTWRYVTWQIYDNIAATTSPSSGEGLQETRLKQDVYYLEKPRRKTEALIFGSHDNSTLEMTQRMSTYLDTLWGAENVPWSMYYLNGQDNSLVLISTLPLKDLTSGFKESTVSDIVDSRRAEMLQQANALDERESFSNMRRLAWQNGHYFTLRTTFNQPGHLATVVAFDLPINDLIPPGMPLDSFRLEPDATATGNNENEKEGTDSVSIHFNSTKIEISSALNSTDMRLVWQVPYGTLLLDTLQNILLPLLLNIGLLALALFGYTTFRHFPSLSIIVLTMNNNPAILSAVLDLDIEGIVLKQGAPTDLPKALAALQKGKKFTPESVSRLLEKISAGGYGDKRLSPKESEVLRLFAEGFLVTEIAKKLNRSIKTISSQKKSAMMKLGVENDIALLNYLSSVTLSPADKD